MNSSTCARALDVGGNLAFGVPEAQDAVVECRRPLASTSPAYIDGKLPKCSISSEKSSMFPRSACSARRVIALAMELAQDLVTRARSQRGIDASGVPSRTGVCARPPGAR